MNEIIDYVYQFRNILLPFVNYVSDLPLPSGGHRTSVMARRLRITAVTYLRAQSLPCSTQVSTHELVTTPQPFVTRSASDPRPVLQRRTRPNGTCFPFTHPSSAAFTRGIYLSDVTPLPPRHCHGSASSPVAPLLLASLTPSFHQALACHIKSDF